MGLIRKILSLTRRDSTGDLEGLRDKFAAFQTLLEKNNSVLKMIADLEEKSHGHYMFDMNYLKNAIGEIRWGVKDIIEQMIGLGGDQYLVLLERYREISVKIEDRLPGKGLIEIDDFTASLDEVDHARAASVGGKNAQLGEMKEMGMPVPEGFAITAWAYKHFVDSNNLQARINERLSTLDLKSYQDLVDASNDIQAMIRKSPVPEDLAEDIMGRFRALKKKSGVGGFALRSSAFGEDTHFSFAGQYESFLNVVEDNLLDTYREVLAGKFSPKAIYYFLSHGLFESDFGMAVGCIAMVDSAVSGVVYTMDPVTNERGGIVINSVYGLGKYLVDGTVTPDEYHVSRDDFSVVSENICDKPVMLEMHPDGGVAEREVPPDRRFAGSLTPEQISRLARYAHELEEHYGAPQDIEWAIDGDGEMYLLQTRPLRVLPPLEVAAVPGLDEIEVLVEGGTTICPGAGSGQVYHAFSTLDLPKIPEGAVVVSHHPFAGLITVMSRASAIVTEVGGVASHMATIAREYRVPTLANIGTAHEIPVGETVTVDATCGKVYLGSHVDLIEARNQGPVCIDGREELFELLEDVLEYISPLNLIHTSEKDFVPENCVTFHDITRFAHQKAMEEMFNSAVHMKDNSRLSVEVKTDLPLKVKVIELDSIKPHRAGDQIVDDELDSMPMRAFWEGIKAEGWPRPAGPMAASKKFTASLSSGDYRSGRREYAATAFALLSKEFMILMLRMGYHFTTIEAMCAKDPAKNYIRMQFKDGGAVYKRRILRIKLIQEICRKMGFENASKGDYLDTTLSYHGQESICGKLRALGRLSIMTKQLDMALANESVADWYTDEFASRLGLLSRDGEGEVEAAV